MVTAELAVTILTAFTLLIMMCWGVYLVILQLRCTDVAAAVARQVARRRQGRGGPGRAQAPRGATVQVNRSPRLVTVTVRVRAKPLSGWLVTVPLRARAQVVPEPTGPE